MALLEWIESKGLKVSTIEHGGESVLLIGSEENQAVMVAFKGVDTLWDILHTLRATPVPAPLGGTYAQSIDLSLTKLSRGNSLGDKALDEILQLRIIRHIPDTIISRGNSLMDKITAAALQVTGAQDIHDVKFGVSGFSYGGALAQGYAAHLAQQGLKLSGLYAFAAPAIGDKAFVKTFEAWANNNNADFIRIDRDKDPVPSTAEYAEFLSQQIILKPDGASCLLHNRPATGPSEAWVAKLNTIIHLLKPAQGDHNFGLYELELDEVTAPLKQCAIDPTPLNQNDIRNAITPASPHQTVAEINP